MIVIIVSYTHNSSTTLIFISVEIMCVINHTAKGLVSHLAEHPNLSSTSPCKAGL